MAAVHPLHLLRLLFLLAVHPISATASDHLSLPPAGSVATLASAHNTSVPILLSPVDAAFSLQFAPYLNGTRRILVVLNQLSNQSTIVWIANRDRPVSPNATLQVTAAAAIVLLDGGDIDAVPVWSSPGGIASIRMNDTGNLVMQDRGNKTVWQSFDHATDVMVAGQSLTSGQNLMASISADNVSTGHYVLRVEAGGVVLYASFDEQQKNIPYAVLTFAAGPSADIDQAFHSQCNHTELIFSNGGSGLFLQQEGGVMTPECVKERNGSTVVYSSGSSGDGGFRYLQLMPTGSIASFLSSADGRQTRYDFINDFLNSTYCKLPAYCNVNSLCATTQVCPDEFSPCDSFTKCSCPDYFVPMNDTDPRQGCRLQIPLNCSIADQHEFSQVAAADYFANSYMTPAAANVDSPEKCIAMCRPNCSCTAAFYNNQTGACHLYDQVQTMQSGSNPSVTAFLRVSHLNPSTNTAASNSLTRRLVTGLSAGLVGLLLVGLLLVVRKLGLWRRAKEEGDDSEEEAFLGSLPGLPPRYSFKELEAATEGFSKKLGAGGSGSVYEGFVRSKAMMREVENASGTGAGGLVVKVAVKQLLASEMATIAASGKKQFRQEVAALGTLSHVNLVRLRGFCADGKHRLLVYEYMENGSLDRWIFQSTTDDADASSLTGLFLPWEVRYRIATDTARGLAFLHEGSRDKVLHLDVKPQNILLDADFRAKLADFGLCKLIHRSEADCGDNQTVTVARGTPGYMAPEVIHNLPINEKCDVYSYGMVVLELVGGRKNLDLAMGSEDAWYFPAWAMRQAEGGDVVTIIDRRLLERLQLEGGRKLIDAMESMKRLIRVAFWCIQQDAKARPTMSNVLLMLEQRMEVKEPPLGTTTTYVLRVANSCAPTAVDTTTTTTSSGRNKNAAAASQSGLSISRLEPR